MSRKSTGLKKSSGKCLKLAKQWYSIWVKWCYFLTTAEALVRCDGKLQHILIAYFLSNMCAKHYENPIMLSRVTAKNAGDVFLRHSVQLIGETQLTDHRTSQCYFQGKRLNMK